MRWWDVRSGGNDSDSDGTVMLLLAATLLMLVMPQVKTNDL